MILLSSKEYPARELNSEEADLIINLSSPDTQSVDLSHFAKPVINVHNKSDIRSDESSHLFISCKTGEGIDILIDQILGHLLVHRRKELPVITRERHRIHLSNCLENLKMAGLRRDMEIRAEYLRLAIKDLGRIIGIVDNEQILDKVFSSFCIGK